MFKCMWKRISNMPRPQPLFFTKGVWIAAFGVLLWAVEAKLHNCSTSHLNATILALHLFFFWSSRLQKSKLQHRLRWGNIILDNSNVQIYLKKLREHAQVTTTWRRRPTVNQVAAGRARRAVVLPRCFHQRSSSIWALKTVKISFWDSVIDHR